MKRWSCAVVLLAGCKAVTPDAGPTDLGPPAISLAPVPLGAEPDTFGNVTAVADLGDSFVAFGDRGAIAVHGASSTTADGVKAWSAAAAVRAADGSGTWPLAVDEGGQLVRVNENAQIEDVGERYGLHAGEAVRDVVAATADVFVVVLEASVLVADVAHGTTNRFETGALEHVSATAGRVAGVAGDEVHVIDLTSAGARAQHFTAAGAKATEFDGEGHVVALTDHALLREMSGRLVEVHRDDGVVLHGLARTGAWTWFGSGTAVWAMNIAGTELVPGATIPADASLAAAAGGDLWVVGGALSRLRSASTKGNETTWNAAIAPIYTTVCAACHGPTGASAMNLSTADAWMQRRAAIRARVLDGKTMPPQPTALTREQLDAIGGWLAE